VWEKRRGRAGPTLIRIGIGRLSTIVGVGGLFSTHPDDGLDRCTVWLFAVFVLHQGVALDERAHLAVELGVGDDAGDTGFLGAPEQLDLAVRAKRQDADAALDRVLDLLPGLIVLAGHRHVDDQQVRLVDGHRLPQLAQLAYDDRLEIHLAGHVANGDPEEDIADQGDDRPALLARRAAHRGREQATGNREQGKPKKRTLVPVPRMSTWPLQSNVAIRSRLFPCSLFPIPYSGNSRE